MRRAADVERLVGALRGRSQVFLPQDADEPILAAPVRSAVFGWLAELQAKDELAAVKCRPRTSCLLSGPPGCGKTTLAHHLAARLGVPMVNVGSEHVIESAMGQSERNLARLFDAIEDYGGPCLLFLDEIDSIGSKRRDTSGDRGGAVGAMNSVLNVLLRKVEAFDGVLIGATNRADQLDPALWRRFGMQIVVDIPDFDARWAILKQYGLPFVFEDEILDELTMLCSGAAPSLLRQLMEGVKRLVILGERLRQPADSLETAFGAVVAQTRPHPDYQMPPLWADTAASLSQLGKAAAGAAWPPRRAA